MTLLDSTRTGGLAGSLDAVNTRERAKEREQSDELWALCVAQALVAELPRAMPLPAPGTPSDANDGADASTTSDTTAPVEAGSAQAAAWDRAAARSDAATGSGASGDAQRSDGIPAELCTEVSDGRLGRLSLRVARGPSGLDIVINVADSHVKTLIEAEQAILMKTLKDAGLRVASVQIGSTPRAGTALALDREGSEKARPNASFRQPASRWRAYQGSLEEDDADSEGVDLTA